MTAKWCKRCGVDRPLTEWPKDKSSPTGIGYVCSPCNRERASRWQKENAKRASERKLAWQRANPERKLAAAQKLRREQPERVTATKERWRKKNLGRMAAHSAAYRARRAEATPAWLSETDHKDMAAAFAMSDRLTRCLGIRHEVDHIVPLKGESVCGLHVPWNLAPVPVKFNRSKGNRLKGVST